MTKPSLNLHPRLRQAVACALLAAGTLGVSAPALAFDFEARGGDWLGNLDTTVSYGQAWRVQTPDKELIGTANGGSSRSPNSDDGNLNYRVGEAFSQTIKAVSEFSFKRADNTWGVFVRGSVLYDHVVEEENTNRTPISKAGRRLAGTNARLLDAFVFGKFDLGERPLEVRAGALVVNWGESTFIQGGVNTVNHVDVSALRVPGAELREAFLPQEMVQASLGLSENLTAEAFYLLDWDNTEPEPVGTYFSANDFVPAGGSRVGLGFGAFSDQGVDFRPLGGPLIGTYQQVPRDPTRDPGKSGQFGVALRWFLPDFSSGTELGFFFIKYHSRLPLISGRTGTVAGIANGAGAATAVGGAAQGAAAGLPQAGAIATAANAAVARAAAGGGNLSLATATQYATIGYNTAISGGNVTAQATGMATHEYAQTAAYFTEFPEDIKLFGLSFNTQLGTSGVALQGELTYRQDVPLQYDDVEVLFAALTPFEAGLAGGPLPTSCISAAPTLSRCGQLGAYAPNTVIRGWDRFDVMQLQATATKALPPMLGAQQLVLVGEVGVTHVPDLPSQTVGGPNGRGIRFNGPQTNVSGNAALAGRHFGEFEPSKRFASATSWGYRLAARLDYPSLVGPWNISPRLTWQQDVSGTTPGPGGNFVEGRYGATLGVNANYQSAWELDVSYTTFGGAGRFNELGDRDFVAASIKYSF